MSSITILDFLNTLKKHPNFQAEIGQETDNIVQAVDNSIYELRPKAVIYPKSAQDIQSILALSSQEIYSHLELHFTPRGGGTGTNGQSLTNGILIDVTKHMNNIIDYDEQRQEVTVQPGVTLEQLNAYLKEYGYFFPPNVSSGSRATIGGMLATDASGMGSRVYGKTSDWINEITALLSNGENHTFSSIALAELENSLQQNQQSNIVNNIYQQTLHSITQHRQLIEKTFPKMNRGLTGYNLKHTLQFVNENKPQQATHLNLCYLLSGSEGTLCIFSEIKCRVQSIPKYKSVAAVLYQTLPQAIEAVPHLIKADPNAIEFINDEILNIAQQEQCWQDIAPLIQQGVKNQHNNPSNDLSLGGINFIQLVADEESEMQHKIARLEQCLQEHTKKSYTALGWHIANSQQAVDNVWAFRKKAQGLIASPKGRKRSIAFIEDTAVPVEKLPIFIKKLTDLFSQHQIQANIYGHADVGCVHVRPNLDLTNHSDRKLIRYLSDEIFQITQELGGLIWGEHGKGVRGEYNPQQFGKTLYSELQKIKQAFDPHNRLNPGKVATPYSPLLPDDSSTTSIKKQVKLLKLDQVPMRADSDAQILPKYEKDYAAAIYCNGNGACFNWNANEPLCPSYKVTRDRRHSPKGRAMLLREWLKLSLDNQQQSISQEIIPIMNNCFGCGACTHHCPLHVNIPDLRAKFLSNYYQDQKRPLKDYLIANIENITTFIGKRAWLAHSINALQNNSLIKRTIKSTIGMIDLPQYALPNNIHKILKKHAKQSTNKTQNHHTTEKIILVADCFNRYYDPQIIIATLIFLKKLGIHATLAPALSSGKAQHIKGYLKSYHKTAQSTLKKLNILAKGSTLIGIDSSITLTYRNEYTQLFGKEKVAKVHLLSEWLYSYLKKNPSSITNPISNVQASSQSSYRLLLHCSENTAAPDTAKQWQAIYTHFNISLATQKLGCCGMAGSFGHEYSNYESSKKAYQLSWKKIIEENQEDKKTAEKLLSTGYSCRSQIKRFNQIRLPHPIEILSQL